MTNQDEVPARAWADMARASALLRAVVSAVDRLIGRCLSNTIHPELAMALIESSQSAQRALVMLAEARLLLADRSPLPLLDAMTEGVPATPVNRREDK